MGRKMRGRGGIRARAIAAMGLASLVGVACGSSQDRTGGATVSVAPTVLPSASAAPSGNLSLVACDPGRTPEVAWRQAACAAADATSCRELATMYGYGRGVRPRPDLAKGYAEKGCDGGDGSACWLRAVFDGPPSEKSVPWLDRGCRAGHGGSCLSLGALVAPRPRPGGAFDACHGKPSSVDGCVITAIETLARAEPRAVTDALDALAQAREDTARLGACDLRDQLTKRPSIRMSGCDFGMAPCAEGCEAECEAEIVDRRVWSKGTLEAGCGRGDLAFCDGLGRLLAHGAWRSQLGTILEEDRAGAAAVFTKNCAAGFAPSCEAEGALHEIAAIVAVDPATVATERARAIALYEGACAARQPTACYRLGGFATGDASLGWYRKACELGMKPVCMDLAEMYATGKGAAKDPKLALDLALKAK